MSIPFNEYIDKYSQPINQTVTSKDITVTGEKVVCDGRSLYVSYIIKKILSLMKTNCLLI